MACQATRGLDYMFVYSAAGRPFTVNMGKISGALLNASWYDPRSGETRALDKIANRDMHKFQPPTTGYGRDWVLILDDAGKGYKVP